MGNDNTITDIWFMSKQDLRIIARKLGLTDGMYSFENGWEWATGKMLDVELSISRRNSLPPDWSETRIFTLNGQPFEPEVKQKLLAKIHNMGSGPIECGNWVYLHGNEVKKTTVEVIDKD